MYSIIGIHCTYGGDLDFSVSFKISLQFKISQKKEYVMCLRL